MQISSHNACKLISVIIPALNEEENIARCLESISVLDINKSSYEVILVDNGSADKTCTIAEAYKKKFELTIIIAPKVNISALRNIGAANSRGKILAFVDADCTVSRNWMSKALPYFKDHTIGAVGSSVGIPENTTWIAKAWDLNLSQRRVLGEIECLPTGNLFVSRDAYYRINGFREDLVTNEDYDFCYRLREQGWRVYSDPELRVIHWGVPKNVIEFYNREVWHGTHVFKVFLNSVKKMKNWRAVAYSLYFTCCLIFCFLSFIYLLTYGHQLFLIISVIFLILPSAVLSVRAMVKQNLSMGLCMQLSAVYFIYGMARAVSIMKIKNWVIDKNH